MIDYFKKYFSEIETKKRRLRATEKVVSEDFTQLETPLREYTDLTKGINDAELERDSFLIENDHLNLVSENVESFGQFADAKRLKITAIAYDTLCGTGGVFDYYSHYRCFGMGRS
jgi:hypothetical protein